MSIPGDLKYAKSHEWAKLEADGTVTVGITHHAQEQLGDLVFVDPPAVGRILAAGEGCAVVESVKAASDINAPLAGKVIAVNGELSDAPEKINDDAYAAWLFKIKPDNAADLDTLLDAVAYQALVESEED